MSDVDQSGEYVSSASKQESAPLSTKGRRVWVGTLPRTALAVLMTAVSAVTFVATPHALMVQAAITAPVAAGPAIGVTHTQYSADVNYPGTPSAEQVLRTISTVQNQHIMGFGATNPNPAPGVYDWRTLDARMTLISRTGGAPVITLCCSPDWMKGGSPGRTDWSKLARAPLERHFDDFAALSAAVARRYPQVTYFQVWNELKGFYDVRRNRWNIEAYTRLYNKVYLALKAVNPRIRVGGPYVVMDSFSSARAAGRNSELTGRWGVVDQRALDAVRYWLRHKVGADFITVDARSGTRDRGLITNDIEATGKFTAVTDWLRRQTALPIWWSEIYPEVNDANAASNSPHRAAVAFYALIKVLNSGAKMALLWQPQQDVYLKSVALWTDVKVGGGGQALPLVNGLAWLRSALASGRLVTVKWNGFAAVASDGRTTLILDGKTGRSATYPHK